MLNLKVLVKAVIRNNVSWINVIAILHQWEDSKDLSRGYHTKRLGWELSLLVNCYHACWNK
jgi:hypothetical protein